MPTTKCKIEFFNVPQSLRMENSKSKSDVFIYRSSRNLCFKSSLKNGFQELFWLKLSILKKYTTCIYTLIPGVNKRSHIFKQTYSF